ncbi:PqqD family protein [bacterium]|nr:PqqD family protein [bacterium]
MTSFRLNENKMFADVTDGIAIIINSETGIYYGMNAFGTQVYENLANGVSAENILEKIKSFGADEANFKAFIDAMKEKEILLPAQDSGAEAELSEEIAKEDKYELILKEYNDAQELLLADPIHEVKEDEGWSPEKSSLNEDKEDVARREAKMSAAENSSLE